MLATYLPSDDPRIEWSAGHRGTFAPSPRQQVVIDVVNQALAAGADYAAEVIAFAEGVLHPAPEHLVSRKEFNGSAFAFDVACALHYVRGLAARGQNAPGNHTSSAPSPCLSAVAANAFSASATPEGTRQNQR